MFMSRDSESVILIENPKHYSFTKRVEEIDIWRRNPRLPKGVSSTAADPLTGKP
jgi:hypothetical protein